jgi:hypothetical protein
LVLYDQVEYGDAATADESIIVTVIRGTNPAFLMTTRVIEKSESKRIIPHQSEKELL